MNLGRRRGRGGGRSESWGFGGGSVPGHLRSRPRNSPDGFGEMEQITCMLRITVSSAASPWSKSEILFRPLSPRN
jgi:hypothetical protein